MNVNLAWGFPTFYRQDVLDSWFCTQWVLEVICEREPILWVWIYFPRRKNYTTNKTIQNKTPRSLGYYAYILVQLNDLPVYVRLYVCLRTSIHEFLGSWMISSLYMNFSWRNSFLAKLHRVIRVSKETLQTNCCYAAISIKVVLPKAKLWTVSASGIFFPGSSWIGLDTPPALNICKI